MTIRYASQADRAFWKSLDGHLPEEAYDRKIAAKQAYVLEEAGEGLAILRFGLFWDTIPFCNLLCVAEGRRGRGLGRALAAHWEREMGEKGFGLLMTSTQADEEGQHFWRKLGYRDCGGFLLPFPGYEQPLELILAKPL
jgi:GNAT superfamily N-acetyltransferase